VNSTTKNTPNDIWLGLALNEQPPRPIIQLQGGDKVRIKNNPDQFRKKHLPNFSDEVHTITSIDGLGYHLDGKRQKYFISDILHIDIVESPDLVSDQDLNK
jgi:hypothetical protein